MNSGVEPVQSDYKFRRKLNQMAMGMRKYEGKGDMVKALSILKGNDRKQGSKHFYNSSDPFALSIMITDLTNKPASQIFYENAFKKFSKNKFMHWVSDKKGITVAQARLTMSALDWSNFGQYNHDEMTNNTCLGKFYKEGIKNSVETKRDNVRYGYQFWVYVLDNEPVLTMTGHGGFFNMLRRSNQSVMSVFSVDPEYQAGNLFGKGVLANIGEIVLE